MVQVGSTARAWLPSNVLRTIAHDFSQHLELHRGGSPLILHRDIRTDSLGELGFWTMEGVKECS